MWLWCFLLTLNTFCVLLTLSKIARKTKDNGLAVAGMVGALIAAATQAPLFVWSYLYLTQG